MLIKKLFYRVVTLSIAHELLHSDVASQMRSTLSIAHKLLHSDVVSPMRSKNFGNFPQKHVRCYSFLVKKQAFRTQVLIQILYGSSSLH